MKLSIIIPCYNERILSSKFLQIKNWQLNKKIVIDDIQRWNKGIIRDEIKRSYDNLILNQSNNGKGFSIKNV